VRRGDAVRIRIPSEGIRGDEGILFVVSVVHTLSAGDFNMSLDLTHIDPLDPNKLKELREAALRKQKRAENVSDDENSDDEEDE
jgi:hypothetical protein